MSWKLSRTVLRGGTRGNAGSLLDQSQPDQKTKQPWFYRSQNGDPLALAGVWEHWQQGEKVIESCSLIVCAANGIASPVHDRMPVILGEADWADWLDPAVPPEAAKTMMRPCPEEWIRTYPVSRLVSVVRNEGPELIEPLEQESAS